MVSLVINLALFRKETVLLKLNTDRSESDKFNSFYNKSVISKLDKMVK